MNYGYNPFAWTTGASWSSSTISTTLVPLTFTTPPRRQETPNPSSLAWLDEEVESVCRLARAA